MTEKHGDRPDILLIMTDQHSKHFLGCYGNQLIRTPNLDNLAEKGMRFDNAYCPSPLCVPSRMSFMTCQTPSAIQVWNNRHILNSGIPTWAHIMAAAGYETTLVGRMHFFGPDQRHGFEHRPIAEAKAGPVGIPRKGGPLWTKFPSSTTGQSREVFAFVGKGHTHYQWQDEERTRIAVNWLREKSRTTRRRPFVAVLGYNLPHCPFVAPKELFDYYYQRVDTPTVEQNLTPTVQRFLKLRGLIDPPLPEERVRKARAAYYGLCEHVDSLVGQVLQALEDTGLAENTLVIYTSDHGEMAGEHGCWWKSNYYEGSAGIPLIVRWPGRVPAGTVTAAICNLMDVGPTFAEVAGTGFPYPIDGSSLLTLLREGRDDSWINETYSEFIDHRGGKPLPSRMIRSGPWKLWCYADDTGLPPALFNLEHDPGELHDLGVHPEYSDVRNRLLEKICRKWDPRTSTRKSLEYWRYFDVLYSWGQTVKPDSADVLVFPPAESEDDVELL